MHSDVCHMGRHASSGVIATEMQELFVARGVKLQQRRSKLKALSPFGPTLGCVAACFGKHGRGAARRAASLDRVNARRRPRPEALELRREIAGGEFLVEP